MTFLGAGILAAVLTVAWLAWCFWHAPTVEDEWSREDDEFVWGVWIGMDTVTPHERARGGQR